MSMFIFDSSPTVDKYGCMRSGNRPRSGLHVVVALDVWKYVLYLAAFTALDSARRLQEADILSPLPVDRASQFVTRPLNSMIGRMAGNG